MNRISVNSLTSELIVAESSLIKDESSSLLYQISYNRSYVSRCLNKVLVLKINKDIDHQWTSDRQAEWSVHTLNLKADWIINMDTCRLCKKQPFTLQTQQIWGHLLTSNLPSEAAEATGTTLTRQWKNRQSQRRSDGPSRAEADSNEPQSTTVSYPDHVHSHLPFMTQVVSRGWNQWGGWLFSLRFTWLVQIRETADGCNCLFTLCFAC